MSQPQYVFALALNHTDVIDSILGTEVLRSAWRKLTAALEPQLSSMFTRYLQVSDICSEEYLLYLVVELPDSDPLFAIQEQQQVLVTTGRRYVRDMLISHFGGGSGRKVDFSVMFTPVPDNTLPEDLAVNAMLATHGISDLQASVQHHSSICPYSQCHRSDFERVLAEQALQTYAQSIVDLRTNSIAGYEVLTRGPKGSVVERADKLFGAAAHFGLSKELELACAKQALRYLPQIAPSSFLTINLGPELLAGDELFALLQTSAVKPYHQQLAFELTEHQPLANVVDMSAAVQRLQNLGVRVLLDDTGCGYFDLSTAEVLKPTIVKLCITVINQLQAGATIEREITATQRRLAKIGTHTLGEGVEHSFQIAALKRAGVHYAQGYFFDKPQPILTVLMDII